MPMRFSVCWSTVIEQDFLLLNFERSRACCSETFWKWKFAVDSVGFSHSINDSYLFMCNDKLNSTYWKPPGNGKTFGQWVFAKLNTCRKYWLFGAQVKNLWYFGIKLSTLLLFIFHFVICVSSTCYLCHVVFDLWMYVYHGERVLNEGRTTVLGSSWFKFCFSEFFFLVLSQMIGTSVNFITKKHINEWPRRQIHSNRWSNPQGVCTIKTNKLSLRFRMKKH